MGGFNLSTLTTLLIISTALFSTTNAAGKGGVAIMGLDLGEEYFKVAIVKPGVPMEIALNKESKRKTPTVVSIKSDEILTGTDGLSKSIQFPQHSFRYALSLLGKTIDSPAVAEYKKLFAGMMEIEEDKETGTVVFKHPELEKPVSVEQVVALVLKNAATTAANYAEVAKVKDTVITVPVFMNQHERERLIYVAEQLAGLKVLQIINQNAAIALNFGMFRRKEFADATKYFVIYDSGATQNNSFRRRNQNGRKNQRSNRQYFRSFLGPNFRRSPV